MEILEAPSRFAEQLRARRQAERISMHRLADRSQTSVAMVCQIENGKSTPTLRTAERIAAGLGASLEERLRDAGARPTSQIESTTPEEGPNMLVATRSFTAADGTEILSGISRISEDHPLAELYPDAFIPAHGGPPAGERSSALVRTTTSPSET